MKYADIQVGQRFCRVGDANFCERVAGVKYPWLKQDDKFVEYIGRPLASIPNTRMRWYDPQCEVEFEVAP